MLAGTWPRLIPTSALRALQSTLTPKSPVISAIPGPTTCYRPQSPLRVSAVGRAAGGLGTSHQGSSFPNYNLTQCGYLGLSRPQEDGSDQGFILCVLSLWYSWIGWKEESIRTRVQAPCDRPTVSLSLEAI